MPTKPPQTPQPPPPPAPSPADPAADPITALLAAADAVTDVALAAYTGPRKLSAAQAGGYVVVRRQLLRDLADAGREVIAHNFGARAPLGDIEERVKALYDVAERILSWAFRRRGLAPPPPPEDDGTSEEPPPVPEWPEDVGQAVGERIVLWEELASARQRLELLCALGPAEPTTGPIPPDRFKWKGAEAEDLAPQQYRLLSILWSAGRRLDVKVPVNVVTQALYETDDPDEATVKALEQLRRRTHRSLDASNVRVHIGMRRGEMWLFEVPD
jgi:hypothetical protein